MFAGFDYGTSNCAIGTMLNQQVQLLPLSQQSPYLASTVYAPERDIISAWLAQVLPESELKQAWLKQQSSTIFKGKQISQELSLDGIAANLSFGPQALELYLEEPDEGYYIKSPKSFLGASGLNPHQIGLFKHLVCAMFCHIKQQAEACLQHTIDQVVIGRPVNFQGLKGEESNRQAINILTEAGKMAGFKDIEFQYEPIAAGFAYEATMTQEQKVLVVDIGGGTTDISMMLMGPEFAAQTDRSASVLGHAGERVGGNDFDIHLALRGLMPEFGLGSQLITGKPMPSQPFFDAVAINNVASQTRFYSRENLLSLQQLQQDSQQPEHLNRLIKVQQHKLSYQLVNQAEQVKKRLSEQDQAYADLSFIQKPLAVELSQQLFANASAPLLHQIQQLISATLAQAQTQPDVIFITGGSAKSPLFSTFLQQAFPTTPLVEGDHFGSVASGLTRWAERCFTP
ncbi:molecular chaperone [Motilimonas pumila]|uniref:Molecular chaperone n=1 Tax=Motilimonas pumila TaxID=2303987 RepID=A0A418YIR9_9GAMM|nr:molecular chaperone [Motilimonas pumila]RJG50545.1 molecular chaperone [Motilimonas pumila]